MASVAESGQTRLMLRYCTYKNSTWNGDYVCSDLGILYLIPCSDVIPVAAWSD